MIDNSSRPTTLKSGCTFESGEFKTTSDLVLQQINSIRPSGGKRGLGISLCLFLFVFFKTSLGDAYVYARWRSSLDSKPYRNLQDGEKTPIREGQMPPIFSYLAKKSFDLFGKHLCVGLLLLMNWHVYTASIQEIEYFYRYHLISFIFNSSPVM